MTTKVRMLLTLLVALGTVWMTGCGHYTCNVTLGTSCTPSGSGIGGTSGSGSATAAYAYAVDTAGTVDGFTLNTSANTFLPNSTAGPTIPLNDMGVGMVVAQQQFLYAGFHTTGQIFGWSIDSTTGALTTIPNSPYAASFLEVASQGLGQESMLVNPAGTLLFIADTGEEKIYAYQIGSGGVLSAVVGSPFSTSPFQPTNMTTDGLGRYLYATNGLSSNHTGSQVAAYAISNNTSSIGALTPVGSPITSPMWQVEGEPTGQFLIGTTGNSLVSSGADDKNLYVFSINQSTGAITQVSVNPTQFSPFTIAVQPNTGGNLVYSFGINDTDSGYNPIEGFALSASTGTLTAVTGSPFSNISDGYWGQFDQSGTYLFPYSTVVDPSTNVVVNQLGVLTVTSGALTQPISPLTLNTGGYFAVTDPQ